MSQWSVNLGESVFLSTSSDPLEQERDIDGDGLKDDLESKLADYFRPYYKFDKDEDARRESEPITLFQVSPINKYYSGLNPPKEVPKQIWIRWVFLFEEDGGYGPDSWCGDAHKGDNDSATYRLISTDDGITWELEHVILGAYTRPRIGMYLGLPNCKLEEAPGYPHHPVIFMSAHKHHMYFDNSYNHKDSFYSKHGCNDDVAGDGDEFLSDLSSISKITGSPLLNNVGEPNRLLEKLYANPLPHIDFGINPITSSITDTVRITKKTARYQRKINASILPVFVNDLDPYFEGHYAWDLFDFYEVGPNYKKWMYPGVCSTWCLVANTNTKEFHRDFCGCAKKIYPEHKVYLKGGVNFASSLYDGCAFCQHLFHTPGF